MKKILLLSIPVLIFSGLVIGIAKVNAFARAGTAYTAKILCSEVFVAGRTAQTVNRNEFDDIHPMFDKITRHVDEAARTVSTNLYGFGKAQAVYREGRGCTVKVGLLAHQEEQSTQPPIPANPFPVASRRERNQHPRIDYPKLTRLIDGGFEDNSARHRALIVAVDGKIVYERYADYFSPATPMLSWSAAKSVLATLVGIAVKDGLIDINAPVGVPEWRGDKRRSVISWDDMLRMTSGLDFEEDYSNPNSDVNRMLFKSRSMAQSAAKAPAKYDPGTVFSYSSGTSNILARSLGDVVEEELGVDLVEYAYEKLLKPLGMQKTVLETDAGGDFVGSSYMYASPREWLKLGQLYLNKGKWNGVQIFDEDWDAYVTSPTSVSENQYGAHFWLNRDGAGDLKRKLPIFPEDMYYFAGHDGHYVFVEPTRNMVVVRLGLTRGKSVFNQVAPLISGLTLSVQPLSVN